MKPSRDAWAIVGVTTGGTVVNIVLAGPVWHWTPAMLASRTAGAVGVLGAQALILSTIWAWHYLRHYRLRITRKETNA